MDNENTNDSAAMPPASAGSLGEPIGWQRTDEFGRPSGFLSWKEGETRWPKNESVPLYLQPKPTLTDEERAAIEQAVKWYDNMRAASTLRALLERLK